MCRTHLRAYLESLTQSIEAWEQAERSGARAAKESAAQSLSTSYPRRREPDQAHLARGMPAWR